LISNVQNVGRVDREAARIRKASGCPKSVGESGSRRRVESSCESRDSSRERNRANDVVLRICDKNNARRRYRETTHSDAEARIRTRRVHVACIRTRSARIEGASGVHASARNRRNNARGRDRTNAAVSGISDENSTTQVDGGGSGRVEKCGCTRTIDESTAAEIAVAESKLGRACDRRRPRRATVITAAGESDDDSVRGDAADFIIPRVRTNQISRRINSEASRFVEMSARPHAIDSA
jgi:hypothetical protein